MCSNLDFDCLSDIVSGEQTCLLHINYVIPVELISIGLQLSDMLFQLVSIFSNLVTRNVWPDRTS